MNSETINSILSNLHSYQNKLAILATYPFDDFSQDFTKIESAKYLLQISIQCCLDIAFHIISEKGYSPAQDSYDAFVILQKKGIFPESIMPTLRQMVSFRNRVVHLYWEVDDVIVYEILQNNLSDFTTFVHHILDFLNPLPDNG